MAYYYPEGSKVYYSTTFAGAKTVSAVTNANPAVATSTSHGYTDLDPVLFNTGWEDANNTIWEVDQQSADTFQLEGLDSSSTTYYPAGTGTGTTQLVSAWTEIPQILDISSTGGGPKYGTVSPLGRRNDIKTPIGFEAMSIDMGLGYDATNATWQAMLGATTLIMAISFLANLLPPMSIIQAALSVSRRAMSILHLASAMRSWVTVCDATVLPNAVRADARLHINSSARSAKPIKRMQW